MPIKDRDKNTGRAMNPTDAGQQDDIVQLKKDVVALNGLGDELAQAQKAIMQLDDFRQALGKDVINLAELLHTSNDSLSKGIEQTRDSIGNLAASTGEHVSRIDTDVILLRGCVESDGKTLRRHEKELAELADLRGWVTTSLWVSTIALVTAVVALGWMVVRAWG